MENVQYLMCTLIWLFIRNTQETPLRATEKLKTGDSLGENQVVTPSWQKSTLLDTKNISALIGKEMTLVVGTIEKSEVQDIQWVKNGVNFATTKPNRGVTIREERYNGRLSSSDDGSLTIHNLAMEDQGDYKADILMVNLKKYEIVYSLYIFEERHPHRTHTVVVSVIIVLVAVAAVSAGVAFWMWKKKKMFFDDNRKNQARSDPEGKCEQEKEKFSPNPQDPSNEDDGNEQFYDAPETQEEGGHTP